MSKENKYYASYGSVSYTEGNKLIRDNNYIVDSNWKPIKKTLKSWKQFAERKAIKKNKGNKFQWTAIVNLSDFGYVKISFAGMPYDIITGNYL